MTPVSGTIYTFALDFPMFIGFIGLFMKSFGPPDLALLNNAKPPKNIKGKASWDNNPKTKLPVLSAGTTDRSTLLSYNIFNNYGSLKRLTIPLYPSIFKNSAYLPSPRTLTLSITWSCTPCKKVE